MIILIRRHEILGTDGCMGYDMLVPEEEIPCLGQGSIWMECPVTRRPLRKFHSGLLACTTPEIESLPGGRERSVAFGDARDKASALADNLFRRHFSELAQRSAKIYASLWIRLPDGPLPKLALMLEVDLNTSESEIVAQHPSKEAS